MTDFVLLGAGFSRAISDAMPLLPDLSRQVLTELGESDQALAPFGGNLEAWLSYLSVDQPWLDDAANLRNRALFYEASQAVRRCIDRAEAGVSYPSAWLERLIHEWCAEGSVVATFNYDTLLERTTSVLGCVATWLDLYGMPLDVRSSPPRGLSTGYSSPPGPAYTLFKLHGSVNWSYGGLEAPVSDRVVLTRDRQMWASEPEPAVSGLSVPTPRFDDLEPLVVPPTGTKAPYYGNRSLRGQWRRTFEALKAASSVTIIGYSFPESDLVTRHWFATANLRCRVTVVDRRPEARDTVRALAPQADVNAHHGASPVQDFVDANCGDFVRWGTTQEPYNFQPRLIVNGQEQQLCPAPGEFDPSLTEQHGNSAMGWLQREVERRYPRLAERRRYRVRLSDPDGTAWISGYTGQRSLS